MGRIIEYQGSLCAIYITPRSVRACSSGVSVACMIYHWRTGSPGEILIALRLYHNSILVQVIDKANVS